MKVSPFHINTRCLPKNTEKPEYLIDKTTIYFEVMAIH